MVTILVEVTILRIVTITGNGIFLEKVTILGMLTIHGMLTVLIDWYTYECLYGQLSGPAVLQKP